MQSAFIVASQQFSPHSEHFFFRVVQEQGGTRSKPSGADLGVKEAHPLPVSNSVVKASGPQEVQIITAIRGYVGAWAAAAIVFLALLFLRASDPINWGQTALFLGLLLLCEAKPVLLPKQRVAFTVTFVITIVAIIHLSPAAVALVSALSVAGSRPEGKWLRPLQLIFNSAQSALAGGLASSVYHSMHGQSGIHGGSLFPVVLAAAAATGIYFLINGFAVSGAVAISSNASLLRTWQTVFGRTAVTYVAFGASGIVLASLFQLVGLISLPLLFVPLLVARDGFRSYQEVSQAYESTVLAFVGAIEAKDIYTRGHSERVAEYGKMIAEKLGIRDSELEIFYFGALLHDVGKLGVRKTVLTKPSKLSREEYEEIKRHPGLGAQIVKDIEFLAPAVESVLYHHERLDGTGYPAGLSGELVPEWARIMGVADTYDAMTSTRAYRGASSPEDAIAELQRCSGTLYDPRCVDAFIEALSDLEPRTAPRPSYEAKVIPNAAG